MESMPSNDCANPLLRDWVKEWMDAAGSRSVKSYYTYKKVVATIYAHTKALLM